MKTSCIIIDEESGVLTELEKYISKIPLLELKGQFCNWPDTFDFFQEQQVDIIFINIDMPGIDFLEEENELPPEQKFVFITTPEKSVKGNFKFDIIDYLPKPLSPIDFNQTVEKIKTFGKKKPINTTFEINHLYAKSGSQMVRINFEEILYIKGEKEYVSLHFKNERLLIYKRMKDIEGLLPSNFMRIHLSFIINTQYIVKVIANKHVFIGAEKIPIGGSYRMRIKDYIDLRTF